MKVTGVWSVSQHALGSVQAGQHLWAGASETQDFEIKFIIYLNYIFSAHRDSHRNTSRVYALLDYFSIKGHLQSDALYTLFVNTDPQSFCQK